MNEQLVLWGDEPAGRLAPLLAEPLPLTDALLPLRPYQREGFDAVTGAFGAGKRTALLVLPTGAGKTVVAVAIQRALGRRCVFLVHRDELAEQTLRKFLAADPCIDIGLCKAESDDLDARVIIASAQTLARPERLDRLVAALAGAPLLVVSDEAHHDPAATRRVALQRLEAASRSPLRLGMTATPMRRTASGREENASLRALYPDGIAYQVGLIELMAEGYLAWLRAKIVETATDLSDLPERGGDFAEGRLAERVDNAARNALVVDAWMQHATGRTRTVVFCASRAHAFAEQAAFASRGVRAEVVIGTTPPRERHATYAALHDGSLPVLIGVDVFTEGWDEPSVDCGVLARPTTSAVLYTQMVGRLLRPSRATGKTDALVLDVTDHADTHRLQQFWTLAAREGLVDARAVAEMARSGDTTPGPADLQALFERRLESRQRTARDADLFGRSDFTWAAAPDGPYMAPVAENLWVYLQREGDDLYRPRLLEGGTLRGDGAQRYATPPRALDLFGRALDLETAMGVAEARGQAHLAQRPHFRRTAAWRAQGVAPTAAQVAYARRMGVPVGTAETKGSLSAKLDAAVFAREYARLARAGTRGA